VPSTGATVRFSWAGPPKTRGTVIAETGGVMYDACIFLLLCSTVLASPFVGALGVVVWHHRSFRAALANPVSGWGLAGATFFGLLALVSAAPLLGQQAGGWRYVPLALINLLVQPVCGLLVAGCVHQFIMGLTGRLTYAFRVVPPERFDGETYRQMVRIRTAVGLLGAAFFGGLGSVCLWQLL
jgi:hypothetical protein